MLYFTKNHYAFEGFHSIAAAFVSMGDVVGMLRFISPVGGVSSSQIDAVRAAPSASGIGHCPDARLCRQSRVTFGYMPGWRGIERGLPARCAERSVSGAVGFR